VRRGYQRRPAVLMTSMTGSRAMNFHIKRDTTRARSRVTSCTATELPRLLGVQSQRGGRRPPYAATQARAPPVPCRIAPRCPPTASPPRHLVGSTRHWWPTGCVARTLRPRGSTERLSQAGSRGVGSVVSLLGGDWETHPAKDLVAPRLDGCAPRCSRCLREDRHARERHRQRYGATSTSTPARRRASWGRASVRCARC
jgi:hypothetical protein